MSDRDSHARQAGHGDFLRDSDEIWNLPNRGQELTLKSRRASAGFNTFFQNGEVVRPADEGAVGAFRAKREPSASGSHGLRGAVLAVSWILAACGAVSKIPEEKETVEPDVVQPEAVKKEAWSVGSPPLETRFTTTQTSARPTGASDEVGRFVPPGARALAVSDGDINDDGLQDMVLVIESPTRGSDAPGSTHTRTVLLLMRGKDRRLHSAGENEKLVPCKECGGMMGDPLVYFSAGRGAVTFTNEGGSGTLWSDEYAFKFSAGRLLLHTVKRSIADRSTNDTQEIQLTPRDFGVIEFEQFDPAVLPGFNLP